MRSGGLLACATPRSGRSEGRVLPPLGRELFAQSPLASPVLPEQPRIDGLESALVAALLAAGEATGTADLVVGGDLLPSGAVTVIVVDVRIGLVAGVVSRNLHAALPLFWWMLPG